MSAGPDMRSDARAIWDAAVAAADPRRLVREELAGSLTERVRLAPRILVVGGGKAGALMAAGLEDALAGHLERVEGIINVPQGSELPTRRIELQVARPAGSNFPTEEGVAGSERMLRLLSAAGPDDLAICLLSGGGSALMPAPAHGVSLEDKQTATRLLHACGASIDEMNAVRKHLSRIKGGRLAQAFRGRGLVSLIISDVIGDPLHVIASGPTAPDPTTFADALAVLRTFDLLDKVPPAVHAHLEAGTCGQIPETLKTPLPQVEHRILASNSQSLAAAQSVAESLGYSVLNLGSSIDGEASSVANNLAEIVRILLQGHAPLSPPGCLLLGGETTVTLGPNSGKGGRNQEFVLALLHELGADGHDRVFVLSGGTDGEDGPTDAAGAAAGPELLLSASRIDLDARDFLARHDSYSFFDRAGGLLRTGLTGTNVMDVAIVLIR